MGRVNLKFVCLALFVLLVLALLSYGAAALLKDTPLDEGHVLVVPIEGVIMYDQSPSAFAKGGVSSKDLVKTLQKVAEDDAVAAVLLDINSPGGTVVASQEIADAVTALDVPVYAVVHDVGASGAYWIATAADTVVVAPMSVVGSIGVISSYLQFSDLFDKYGVDYERLVAGDRKDIGSPYRDLEASERAFLESKLDAIHAYFVAAVARNRGLSEEDVWSLATGEYFLGVEAVELGLADALGSRQDALDMIEEELGISDIKVVETKSSKGLLQYFTQAQYALGYGVGDALVADASGLPLAM